jgi:hypothetical protein
MIGHCGVFWDPYFVRSAMQFPLWELRSMSITIFRSNLLKYSVNTPNPVSDLSTVTDQNYLWLNLSSTLLTLALPLLMLCSSLLHGCSGSAQASA